MSTRRLAYAALVLWGITALGLGYLFVNGRVSAAPDGRESVRLDGNEREFVLTEMRTMLESVRGITAGIAEGDFGVVRRAARVSGVAMGDNVPAAVKARFPQDFRQLGMAVHQEFDELAAAAGRDEPPESLMGRLAEQLGRCVACHQRYRFDSPTLGAQAAQKE